jgi:hypothetical protein
MYKKTQQSRDYLERIGSSSMRPVLAANVNPRAYASHEVGRLADLKDEQKRLRERLTGQLIGKVRVELQTKLSVINDEIRRLNREATETSETQILWKAIHMTFTEEQVSRLGDTLYRLRQIAWGQVQE